MRKQKVNCLGAAGIIYHRKNPTEIFVEMKDDSHPIVHARRKLCFIGGTWIGESAKNDKNPLASFQRELDEELSFDHPTRDSKEYSLLGIATEESFIPTPDPSVKPDEEDIKALARLKQVISESALPFGDFINIVSGAALDAADPDNKCDGFSGCVSYFAIALNDNEWEILVDLQEKFNNLSNESVTLVTSLSEIIKTNTKTAFAHDRVMREFFLSHGLQVAENLPMVEGLESVKVGMPMDTYAEYLEKYDVAKRP